MNFNSQVHEFIVIRLKTETLKLNGHTCKHSKRTKNFKVHICPNTEHFYHFYGETDIHIYN